MILVANLDWVGGAEEHVILSMVMAVAMLTSPQEPQAAQRCVQSGAVFTMSGRIDADLSDCVKDRFSDGTSEIIIDSAGGEHEHALAIAERLEKASFTLRVRERCGSSCANLLLPLANRVIVEPEAYIVLHGSLDPAAIERENYASRGRLIDQALAANPSLAREDVEANLDALTRRALDLLAKTNAFMDRNNIHPGWLFYREPGDRGLGTRVSGALQSRSPEYVLVEERLIRSCLPHVEIAPFQANLEASFIDHEEKYASFQRAGGHRSGDLECLNP